MSIHLLEIGAAGFSFGLLTGGLGYRYLLPRRAQAIDIDDVAKYMRRVVNAEEARESYNLTRKMLHDANRRTMPRSDSGPSAKVHRMRRRRVVRPSR